jgi:ParB family transcriptional regulator, chromosome partitioning protein
MASFQPTAQHECTAARAPCVQEPQPANTGVQLPSTLPPISEAIPDDFILAQHEDGHVLLGMVLIDVQPEFNPRKFFNPETYRELVDSVRHHRRVFQNIIVRPQPNFPGRYWVVAGERRWRAAKEVGLTHIPALILPLADEEALSIAVAENKDRDDITPGEEALSAQRMMHLTDGDREEAAKALGWSPRKLDMRLQLCHATEPVLMALAARKIHLGHAELLCPLPEATQNGTLQEVIARKVSVEELRAKLDAFALDLATACFDKTECQRCPHNTTRQASLFEQTIGEGRCTNRPCFHRKSIDQLETQRIGLRDEYNAVFIDIERAPGSLTLLLRHDVGRQQFNEGCKQCKHFGCLLSSKPGEAGKLTTDVCFDMACHQEKVAAHQATLQASVNASTTASEPSSTEPQGESTPSTKSTAHNGKGPAAAATPKRVLELIHDVHRRVAATEVSRDSKMVQVYAVLALVHELGIMHHPRDADDVLSKHGVRRRDNDPRTHLIGALYALDAPALFEIAAELAGQLAGRHDIDTARYLKGSQTSLKVLGVDLAQHFCLDASFLKAHTKAGIEALLREAGFAAHYNSSKNDPAAVKKLMNTNHADIIKTVMDAGFDFKGFVPTSLRLPEN